jgi:antitoxin ParD1/3/4
MDTFIKSRISTGRYTNANEVIRAGLNLLEEEENRVIALRNAINEGIASGTAHNFNPEKHLQDLKSSRQSNA